MRLRRNNYVLPAARFDLCAPTPGNRDTTPPDTAGRAAPHRSKSAGILIMSQTHTPPTFERIGQNRYKVRDGICLFREGQAATGAFIIESGRVELTRRVRGSQTLLAVAGPGELIGEMALIDGEPRSATAITTAETILVAIPAREFSARLQQLDPMTRMILRKMTRLVRRANETLIFNPSAGNLGADD